MNFALYKELLAIKPVRRLLIVGMIARIPHSAAGVLLTLHIVLTLGEGYAAAGAAAAVMTIGIAVGAPWRGRRVDTVGLRKALIPSVISEAVIWSVVPHVSYEWLLPLVFVGGLLTLPIFSVVRQSLGVMVDGDQRRTAFALDAITTELVFMIGPAAGAIVATSGHSVIGLTVVGVSTSVAGLFLMWFNPPTRSACSPMGTSRTDQQRMRAEVAMVAAAPAHVQEAAAEMAPGGRRQAPELRPAGQGGPQLHLVHRRCGRGLCRGRRRRDGAQRHGCRHRGGAGDAAGTRTESAWSSSSGVPRPWSADCIYGSMHRPVSPMLLLLGMAALTIPMGFAQDTWTLAFLSLLPGLLCAPVLSALRKRWLTSWRRSRRGEAMGWYGSALTAGVALGAPLAGVFIDGIGSFRRVCLRWVPPASSSASLAWCCSHLRRRRVRRV